MMASFKRDIKGYGHWFVVEALVAHRLITGDPSFAIFQLLDGMLALILAVLLIRFVSTNYLIINENQIIIKRDCFLSVAVTIGDIRQIQFATGRIRPSKIEMKNGTKISFRHEYLSREAKKALLDLSKN